MCYYIYGGVNHDINIIDFEKVKSDSFKFNLTTRNKFLKALEDEKWDFRITHRNCDCDTAIGSHKTGKIELEELEQYIHQLTTARNVKFLYLCKKWTDDKIVNEKIVHVDEIYTIDFLANLDENCLYKIELYNKFY